MRIHDADGVQRPPSRRPNEAWVVRDADGIALYNVGEVAVTRYRYRSARIPSPWPATTG